MGTMKQFFRASVAAVVIAWATFAPAHAQVTNVPCNQLPALTGDTTTPAGSCASTTTKINGVDETTAWTSYSPSITCGGGTTAGAVPTGFFKTIGKTTFVRLILTVGTSTCTSAVLGLPNTSQGAVLLNGRETLSLGTGFLCSTGVSAATCAVFVSSTGSGNVATNNTLYTFLGVYDSQ